ncbi:hypothetical protein G6F56_013681 [Rhizopus delemar]|nr:hypothetical protein G6F56_013681 [Rhizopus delemar]
MTQFPALEIKSRIPSNKTSRVLVIKNTPAKKINPKSPWEKPAEPSPSSSERSQQPPMTSNNPPNNTSGSKKKNNPHSLEVNAFPSLPTSAPKHQEILDMRRGTHQSRQNAWGSSVEQEQEQGISNSVTDKKKKGRKNKVLLRVGL